MAESLTISKEQLQSIVDTLFNKLEAQAAGHAIAVFAIDGVRQAVDALVPGILDEVNSVLSKGV